MCVSTAPWELPAELDECITDCEVALSVIREDREAPVWPVWDWPDDCEVAAIAATELLAAAGTVEASVLLLLLLPGSTVAAADSAVEPPGGQFPVLEL